MTVTAVVPKYISLKRAAALWDSNWANKMYPLIAHNVVQSELIGDRPFIIFASLPPDKQERYQREESGSPKTKRRPKR